MRVQIYWNLHKKRWSIRDKVTGLVCGYANTLMLQNCKFVVQAGGRRQVLETNQKNVHAFVEGEILGAESSAECTEQIVYNPYKYETFVFKEWHPVYEAENVFLTINDYRPQVFAQA